VRVMFPGAYMRVAMFNCGIVGPHLVDNSAPDCVHSMRHTISLFAFIYRRQTSDSDSHINYCCAESRSRTFYFDSTNCEISTHTTPYTLQSLKPRIVGHTQDDSDLISSYHIYASFFPPRCGESSANVNYSDIIFLVR